MNIAISYRESTEHRYYLSNPRESIMTTVLSCQRREILPFPTQFHSPKHTTKNLNNSRVVRFLSVLDM